MEDQYLKDFRVRGFLRKIVQKQLKRLRRWDLSTAKRVDHFIANSSETQSRIRRTYGRESVVIPPPVDARFFEASLELPSATVQPYFLALGRLVPYKRFDVLIKLANQHQIHLKIGGTGSDKARLMSLAGPTVEFLDYVPDEDLPALYANAEALLFPQEEDAGIVPMEAQACGTPVIAFRKGGILDVVVAGTTGVFADEQTVESFEKAIDEFRSIAWNRGSIREHAKQFHETSFRRRMREEISTAHSRYVFSSHQG